MIANHRSYLSLVFFGASIFSAHASQNITSIQTVTTTASPSAPTAISVAEPHASSLNGVSTINTTFNNQTRTITSLQTSSGTWMPTGASLDAYLRRSSSTVTNLYWSAGTLSGTGATRSATLSAGAVTDMNQAFSSKNLLIGTDNLFVNSGHSGGNQNNIERVDFYSQTSLITNSGLGFAVFERGGNDPFKIALITSLDAFGNPSSYSTLVSESATSWGNNLGNFNYLIVRDGAASDMGSQGLYGKLFTMADFGIADGTQIYGYSLFASDVTGTGSQLLDWTNTTYFPETLDSNTTTGATNQGGLDLLAYGGFMQFQPIPEPSGLVLLGAASLMLGIKRRR